MKIFGIGLARKMNDKESENAGFMTRIASREKHGIKL